MRPEDVFFSVIIPTHNRPTELANALESLGKQTHKNFEVVLINDGQEPVLDVVQNSPLTAGINSFTLCKTNGNLGPSAARNGGLEVATGDVIAYLDDDDIYHQEHLAVHAEQYASAPKTQVVYSDAERGLLKQGGLEKSVVHSRDFDADALLVANYIPILCLTHKRACLEQTGMFEESLHFLEDWDFFLRLAELGPFMHVPKTTAMYMEKEGGQSIQQRYRGDFIKSLDAVYERSDRILASNPGRQDRIWAMRFAHLGQMAYDTGTQLEQQQDLESAETAYARAAKYAPRPDYYLSLSRVQKALGHKEKALISMQLAQRCKDLEGKQ